MRETDTEEAGEALAGGLTNISVVAPPAAAEATAGAAAASAEETADLEAGGTSQGTTALEAEGKVEIESQALQGAEDKAKLVSEPADTSVEETAAAETAAEKVEDPASPAPSKPAPPKVAYHPNVRCQRGGGGVGGTYDVFGRTDPNWPHPVIVGRMYRVGEGYVCEEKATEEEKAQGAVKPAEDRYGDPVEGFDLRGRKKADILGLRGADGELDLEGAILCGVDLGGAQLQGADLSAAQLQGANLQGAQLQGAKLVEAQLQGARLYEAQLQGARLDIAQLQGVNLWRAQLQAAVLKKAQLQGANLPKAQLQGAELMEAQLQGAYLGGAQLQGADLRGAQLQGADLVGAQLQGADLREAHLQGADLINADLSVLPKGFLLPKPSWSSPKQGAAGETKAIKEDRPTNLQGANLSVLPKGSKYRDRRDGEYKVSNAPRPTNLTTAKASGADFTDADLSNTVLAKADLSGATFKGATVKDATLKDATSDPLKPPERPASAALHGAWRAKALLGSVGRAVVAAADDDDDDDDDSDGESEEEEEKKEKNPIEAEVDTSLEVLMDNLATGANTFMDKVDTLLGRVEERMATILATDGELAKLLRKKLQEGNVTQAAFNGILSTEAVRPLLAVLEKELLKLLKPTDEVSVGADANAEVPNEAAPGATDSNPNDQLLRQLLKTYKEQILSATGESALMKRLSPIIKDCVRASSARAARGRAVDEEQPLLQPAVSAKCLLQQLWPALLASLEAQVSDVILSSALAPIEKAGKSVRRMAERLDKLEDALSTKASEYYYGRRVDAESQRLAKKFGLVGGDKGGLRSRLLKSTLTAATQYEVNVGGFSGSFDMVRLAWTCSRAKLTKHENELQYLKKKLEKLEELTTTDQTWRDVTETWQATLALLKSIEVERGVAVLQCIASDEKLLQALGMAETLYKIKGDAPTDLVIQLNDDVGAHIRTHAYKYDKLIGIELVRIQRVKDIQWRALTLAGSAVVATMIGATNLLSRLYYDVLRSGDSRLAVLLPAGAVALLLLLVLCCCCCYRRRSLMQGAGRLWALRPCGMCSTRKTEAASRMEQVVEEDATAATARA